MYDIPSPKSSAPLRGVAQESNKRRKIYEVEGNEEPNQGAEDDMEPPNSPLPTQAPPDTPGMDVNASIDISVVEDDGIPPSASQSDGIQLSESPSQAISNAQLPGRIFWAASSTTVSVLRPGGGIQDLTTCVPDLMMSLILTARLTTWFSGNCILNLRMAEINRIHSSPNGLHLFLPRRRFLIPTAGRVVRAFTATVRQRRIRVVSWVFWRD
jgi:hypothetical protein